MGTSPIEWIDRLERLEQAVADFAPSAAALGMAPAETAEWHRQLSTKLLPQLRLPQCLVAAIAGGTNTGKSLIFNHLAQERASEVTAQAAGTRHPVALVSPELADNELLSKLLPGFVVQPWEEAEAAIRDDAAHRLFWRVGSRLPKGWVLLDTPDIDSNVPVNWERAERIRQVADVLTAVLTPQKYNDAAVKRFFRQAGAEGKTVVVVFNQCDLEQDLPAQSTWLDGFCRETGLSPADVLLCPRDREMARTGNLFCQRPRRTTQLGVARTPPDSAPQWSGRESSLGPAAAARIAAADASAPPLEPADLREVLSRLDAKQIRLKTLHAALELVVGPRGGAAQWSQLAHKRLVEWRETADRLAAMETPTIHWPPLPARLWKEQLEAWRRPRRGPAAAVIYAVYRTWDGLLRRPVAWLTRWVRPVAADAQALFRRREREHLVRALEGLLAGCETLVEKSSPLSKRTQALLAGESRAALVEGVLKHHEAHPPLSSDDGAVRVGADGLALGEAEQDAARLAWQQRAEAVLIWLRLAATVLAAGLLWGWASSIFSGSGAVSTAGFWSLFIPAFLAVELCVGWAWEAVHDLLSYTLPAVRKAIQHERDRWLQERLSSSPLGKLQRELSAEAAAASPAAHQLEEAVHSARRILGA